MRHIFYILISIALLVPVTGSAATLSIIIDDIGYRRANSIAAVNIDPNITLAILPDAPHSQELAAYAAKAGNELMLHLPMESSVKGSSREPDVLSLAQPEAEFKAMLRQMLERFPQVRGVNNHQGSLLTQQPAQMHWLMESLLERGGLYFVDSKTHSLSVAGRISRQHGLETAERTFFLDSDGDNYGSAAAQADRILSAARRESLLVVIAHPFDASLKVLRDLVPELKRRGHELVPASHLILMMEHRQFLVQCQEATAQVDEFCSFFEAADEAG